MLMGIGSPGTVNMKLPHAYGEYEALPHACGIARVRGRNP
jgi:hypothetical protein